MFYTPARNAELHSYEGSELHSSHIISVKNGELSAVIGGQTAPYHGLMENVREPLLLAQLGAEASERV